jgi:hypothetical protein
MSKLTRAAQRCTDAEGKLAERLIERFDEAIADILVGQDRDSALTVLQAAKPAITETMMAQMSFDERQLWMDWFIEQLREIHKSNLD